MHVCGRNLASERISQEDMKGKDKLNDFKALSFSLSLAFGLFEDLPKSPQV